MSRDVQTKDFGINRDGVFLDRTRIFQLENSLSHTWAGHSDLFCKVFDGYAAVFGQCRDYRSISRVELPGYITASVHSSPLAG